MIFDTEFWGLEETKLSYLDAHFPPPRKFAVGGL